MPRLILLNGVPGIGKSTIARRYADDHAGVLNLDIDRLRTFVGGWRERFGETGEIVRPLALDMATSHLRARRDVVVSQYLGHHDQIARFEQVAAGTDSVYVEVVLDAEPCVVVERFGGRELVEPEQVQIGRLVAEAGGEDHLRVLHAGFHALRRERVYAETVSTDGLSIDQTFDRVCAIVEAQPVTPTPRAVAVVLDDDRVLVMRRQRDGFAYSVLPGGGVEPGESGVEAAERELWEETTLVGRAGHVVWTGTAAHHGRPTTYYVMADVRGEPELSGPELAAHGPTDHFALEWVGPDALSGVGLQPPGLVDPLCDLLTAGVRRDRAHHRPGRPQG